MKEKDKLKPEVKYRVGRTQPGSIPPLQRRSLNMVDDIDIPSTRLQYVESRSCRFQNTNFWRGLGKVQHRPQSMQQCLPSMKTMGQIDERHAITPRHT